MNSPPYCRIGSRNNFSKLKNSFRKTNMGQKTISYIDPSIWNSLPLNTFKHNVKKHYLTWIIHNVYMRTCVSVFMYVCVSVCVCMYIWIYISVFSFELSILVFFFSFILSPHFRSHSRDHNENKVSLPVLCYSSHCWSYLYLSVVIF